MSQRIEIKLDKGQSIEVYAPYGGGIQLSLTATGDGLKVVSHASRLRIAERRTEYSREWTLSRDEEHGFDRT
jgi:hypothetical protein